MSLSCCGCKFLYGNGEGYSNYTWLDTFVTCALDRNPLLPSEEPCDWDKENDNWDKTKNGRCEKYSEGNYIVIDPEREIILTEESDDAEQIKAISESYQ